LLHVLLPLLAWGFGVLAMLFWRQARQARRQAGRERLLRALAERLRDVRDPAAFAPEVAETLGTLAGTPVALALYAGPPAAEGSPAELQIHGLLNAEQRAGIELCLLDGIARGPGCGRDEAQPHVYLPLRGQAMTSGVAVLQDLGPTGASPDGLAHAQAVCDQFGLALERCFAAREERATRERAQEQTLHNAMLAAISHDYRTPLATIMGAASALETQADRLSVEQRRKLAAGIVEEVTRLTRLTNNTLQLARLGAPVVALRCDWESAEEIVGAALRRVRRRPDGARVKSRLEPGLPLLWCDALLVSQLVDNLLDNALKYSPEAASVELLVRRLGSDALIAVRDRGPGIAPAWRERVFEVFKRGEAEAEGQRAGAGVGLAVCRAIARAHGGELRLRPRGHGGSSFEFLLPLKTPPESPE
jgi:two-component system sensor histidine kinase KdpD